MITHFAVMSRDVLKHRTLVRSSVLALPLSKHFLYHTAVQKPHNLKVEQDDPNSPQEICKQYRLGDYTNGSYDQVHSPRLEA